MAPGKKSQTPLKKWARHFESGLSIVNMVIRISVGLIHSVLDVDKGMTPVRKKDIGGYIMADPTTSIQMIREACMIERRITTEYPIRYSAFETPRVLFIAQDTCLATTKNRELAIYDESMRNKIYPILTDGIYAEIRNWHGKEYMAEIHATQPWKGRAQRTEHRFFDDFEKAVTWIEEQIPIYREFCICTQ